MTLIKSISGMRGTIGGLPADNLTALDIVEMAASFAQLVLDGEMPRCIAVGRDGRRSGEAIQCLVMETLRMMGVNVLDLGLSTTPSVEFAVKYYGAGGGIVITASHNPEQWNALKFLNENGEFISAQTGNRLLELAKERKQKFAEIDDWGEVLSKPKHIKKHIQSILDLKLVKRKAIRKKKFHVVVDCINSTGAIAIPMLLEKLGVKYTLINNKVNGRFAHDPEPLEANLTELSAEVRSKKADLGIAVDPDVDRLAFVDEKGRYCGEEYTLVMAANWVLANDPGATVSNLSSTRALRDITESVGQNYYASPVGEVNVVTKMKEVNAVIGGEGNGGIIYPANHYGRDALAGIALVLTALAKSKLKISKYRSQFVDYIMIKNKLNIKDAKAPVDEILKKLEQHFSDQEIDTQDGVKLYFEEGWVHLRKSNTEPIIRVYAEGTSQELTHQYIESVTDKIESYF